MKVLFCLSTYPPNFGLILHSQSKKTQNIWLFQIIVVPLQRKSPYTNACSSLQWFSLHILIALFTLWFCCSRLRKFPHLINPR